LAFLLIGISKVVYGTDEGGGAGASSISVDVDQMFATAYSKTMKGMPSQEDDRNFIAAAHRLRANPLNCRPTDLETVQAYYIRKFLEFTDNLPQRDSQHAQHSIWKDIRSEARQSLTNPINLSSGLGYGI
jgi:hypothetical protein